ncbi:MAG: hypothetical protein R8G34_15245 [Paracoccaceae bacterium]|nr:hypothetical protein [Paracoccaceae bacterium]
MAATSDLPGRLLDQLVLAMPPGTLQRAARQTALAQLADAMGVICDGEALQAVADQMRRRHGLLSRGATISWLAVRGLTIDSWVQTLESDLLEQAFLAHPDVATAGRALFDADPDSYARIHAGYIAVEDEGIAQELCHVLTECDTSFDTLARRYSVLFADGVSEHPLSKLTIYAWEAPGAVRQKALSPGFSGPLDTSPIPDRGLWLVFRVYAVEDSTYDEDTQAHCARRALASMLGPRIQRAFRAILDQLGCDIPDDVASLAVLSDREIFLAGLRRDRPTRGPEILDLDKAGRTP